jgi:hypothetical protein
MSIREQEVNDPRINLGVWSLGSFKSPSATVAWRTKIQGDLSQQVLHFLMAVGPEFDPDPGSGEGGI